MNSKHYLSELQENNIEEYVPMVDLKVHESDLKKKISVNLYHNEPGFSTGNTSKPSENDS